MLTLLCSIAGAYLIHPFLPIWTPAAYKAIATLPSTLLGPSYMSTDHSVGPYFFALCTFGYALAIQATLGVASFRCVVGASRACIAAYQSALHRMGSLATKAACVMLFGIVIAGLGIHPIADNRHKLHQGIPGPLFPDGTWPIRFNEHNDAYTPHPLAAHGGTRERVAPLPGGQGHDLTAGI